MTDAPFDATPTPPPLTADLPGVTEPPPRAHVPAQRDRAAEVGPAAGEWPPRAEHAAVGHGPDPGAAGAPGREPEPAEGAVLGHGSQAADTGVPDGGSGHTYGVMLGHGSQAGDAAAPGPESGPSEGVMLGRGSRAGDAGVPAHEPGPAEGAVLGRGSGAAPAGVPVAEHLIGLLLGTEQDWPRAFEVLADRLGTVTARDGSMHRLRTERVTIEPFSLRDRPQHDLVIDRLAYWYYHPREWLKKVALMDGVYLLNSPFTFQSMEKHAAYCAMMRLGLHVPETVLVPYKNPVDHAKWAYTAERYNRPFDLDAVAERLGYPLFMKPYDGGAWVGVSRIGDSAQLHAAYDRSGERLMHLQQAVEGYDVFTRSLSIGPETMVMKFRPALPMHERYEVAHGFLDDAVGDEVVTISRVVNAFFRWEFNSCECLVRDGVVYPIDYANACPDVALTSLHYYFPWAMTALLRWSVFCLATGRRARLDMDTARYFEIADAPAGYREKLRGYRALADEYFDVGAYREFCDTTLRHVPEMVAEWVGSADFDDLLVSTVRETYPQHEHERFVAHFRGLLDLWRRENPA